MGMLLFAILSALCAAYALAYLLHAAKRKRTAAAFGAAFLALLALSGGALCLLVK